MGLVFLRKIERSFSILNPTSFHTRDLDPTLISPDSPESGVEPLFHIVEKLSFTPTQQPGVKLDKNRLIFVQNEVNSAREPRGQN